MAKEDRCGTCDAYHSLSDDHGLCRAKSPTAFMIGMAQGRVALGNGQKAMKPIVATAFPETGKSGWCREWQQNKDLPHLEKVA